MRLGLILSIRDIYINSNLKLLTKFASSCRSTKFKDILPWNISQMIIQSLLFYGYPCFKLESYFFKRQSHKMVKAIMLVEIYFPEIVWIYKSMSICILNILIFHGNCNIQQHRRVVVACIFHKMFFYRKVPRTGNW